MNGGFFSRISSQTRPWRRVYNATGGVPIDDVESKFRFGRYIERTAGIKIFRHPALERLNP